MASPALTACLYVLLLPAVTGQYQTHHRLGWGGGSCGSPVSELLCQHYIILMFQPIRIAEEVRF